MSAHPEFDLLLTGIESLEGDLAKNLLADRGIPSMLEASLQDSAELAGSPLHVQHPNLFVPKGTRAAARAILVEAWGEARVSAHDADNSWSRSNP